MHTGSRARYSTILQRRPIAAVGKSHAKRCGRCFRSIPDPELFKDVGQVIAYDFLTYEEIPADLLIGLSDAK